MIESLVLLLAAAEGSGQEEADIVILLAGVGFLITGSWGIWRWGQFWRGERKKTGAVLGVLGPRWGKLGQAIYPFGLAVGIPIGLTIIAFYAAERASEQAQQFAEVVSEVLTVVLMVTFVVLFSIVLFNRPRFLIPPHGRDFHGLAGDWMLTIFRRLAGRSAPESAEGGQARPEREAYDHPRRGRHRD